MKEIIKLHITEEALYHKFSTVVAYSDNNITEKANYINQKIIDLLDGKSNMQTILEIISNTYSYLPYDSICNYVCEYVGLLHQCGLCVMIDSSSNNIDSFFKKEDKNKYDILHKT